MDPYEQECATHMPKVRARAGSASTFKRLATICAIGIWSQAASAGYLTSYTTTFPSQGGFATAEGCSGTDCGGFTNVVGTDPFISFSNSQVSASADLRDGKLRFSLADRTSATVQYADELTFSIPGLGPTDTATITFVVRVDGTYARSSDQAFGQANFGFFAASDASFDVVRVGAGYRTANQSDDVNSTAAPDVFELQNTFGDWQQLSTNLFLASVDVIGSDPTLRFAMSMFASGPADFSNTGELALLLPNGATFASASGAFLSASTPTGNGVPEPTSLLLSVPALALLLARERFRKRRR